MNAGLVLKSIREVRAGAVFFAIGLGLAEGMLSFAIPRMLDNYGEQILQMEFVQRIIAGLLGTTPMPGVSAVMIGAFPWVHPVILAIVWAAAITLGTRIPAGEIDRGTIDLLLCLPVSRRSLLVSDSLVCLAVGVVMTGCAALGNVIGNRVAGSGGAVPPSITLAIALNLFALYVAAAGLTYFISACSERRGRAVGVSLTIVLSSFFLSFLAQLWVPAQRVGFLGIMEYYRPLQIAQYGAWPARDLLVLTGCGVSGWIAAWRVFKSRDIRTT